MAIARKWRPRTFMYASHWEANITPFKTYSKMFIIKPASKPPRNTRAKLIFPIGILREQSPECRKSKGAEGTVAWSLRGAHRTSQEERLAATKSKKKHRSVRRESDRKRTTGHYHRSSWAASTSAALVSDLVFGLRSRRTGASTSNLAMRLSEDLGVWQ